jgi:hypothetical protein
VGGEGVIKSERGKTMKKIFLMLCFFIIVGVSVSFANPWLACDPLTPEVTDLQINLAGQLVDVPIANVIKTASQWRLLDLSTINAGSYNQVTVKAKYGLWGWSNDSIPFDFVKPVIDEPVNTRLGVE